MQIDGRTKTRSGIANRDKNTQYEQAWCARVARGGRGEVERGVGGMGWKGGVKRGGAGREGFGRGLGKGNRIH